MVNYGSQLDLTFAALSDPTRRGIVERLSSGQMPVTDLAEPFDMSLPAVSKHLRVLERAGLLRQERKGRIRMCRLEAKPMADASKWLTRYQKFWTDRLDNLATFVEAESNSGTATGHMSKKKKHSRSRKKK